MCVRCCVMLNPFEKLSNPIRSCRSIKVSSATLRKLCREGVPLGQQQMFWHTNCYCFNHCAAAAGAASTAALD